MEWDYRPGNHAFHGIVLQEYDHAAGRLVGPVRNIFSGTELRVTEGPHHLQAQWLVLPADRRRRHGLRPCRDHGALAPARRALTSWTRSSTSSPRRTTRRCRCSAPAMATGWRRRTARSTWCTCAAGRCRCIRDSDQQRCPLGRETAIQKAHWTEDGWLRLANGSNKPDMQTPAPDLPPHPWPQGAGAHHASIPSSCPSTSSGCAIPGTKRCIRCKARPGLPAGCSAPSRSVPGSASR